MEIERKFLVKNKKWEKYSFFDKKAIQQHYLDINDFSEIRIRYTKSFFSQKESYCMTIKSKTDVACQRQEREFSISSSTFCELATHAIATIDKIRHVFYDEFGQFWELDAFKGKNLGIEIAEIELPKVNHPIVFPDFLGKEVTCDNRFYNKNIAFNK